MRELERMAPPEVHEGCCLEEFCQLRGRKPHIDADGCPPLPGLGKLPSLSLKGDRT